MRAFWGILISVFLGLAWSVSQAATLSGKVNFKGTAPKRKPLRMNADPVCMKLNPKPALSEKVVVNKDGTLKNVFVYVKSGLTQKSFPAPKGPVVIIDQQGCQYTPHVFGIRVGQTLEIRNSDPTLHNVHAMPKANPQFNVGMPVKGMKITKKFSKPEIGAKIKCDVHPWMRAYANVMDHPFFSVTGTDGSFEIKDLPPGKYVLSAWHEKYGTKDMNVTVEKGKPATINFEFAATAKK